MGYGGLIHSFKNYVLRGDTEYRTKFYDHYYAIHSIIEERLLHLEDDQMVAKLEDVLYTVDEYESKIDVVDRSIKEGLSPKEIDPLVKVDDRHTLSKMHQRTIQNEYAVIRRAENIHGQIYFFNWIMLLAIPSLIIVALIKQNIFSLLIRHAADRSYAEKRMKSIFDNTHEGIITIDSKGHIEEFNIACETMFGWRREEVLGKNLKMLMTPHHASRHDQYIDNYLMGGRAKLIGQPREFEVLRKGGETFFVEVALAELTHNGEKYFIGVIRDLSERKSFEQDLQERSEMLEMAEKTGKMGHWRYDVITQEIFWSDEVYQIHGVTKEEYVPEIKSAVEFYHPDDRQNVMEELAKTQNDKVSFEFEYRIVRPDGQILYVHSMGEPSFDEEGNVIAIFGVFQDVTSRREYENNLARLREDNLMLIQAIETCQIGIFLADATKPGLPLTFINKHFTDMTGYRKDEVIGKNCRFLQGDDTSREVVETLKQAIADEQPVSVDILNYRKDGTPFWNNLQVSPVYNEKGKLLAYVGTQKEITDLKQTQNALEKERDFIKQIIQYSPNLVVGVAPDGTTQFANQAVLNVMKKSEEDIIGKNWWQECYPNDTIQKKKLFEAFDKHGQVKDHEMTMTDAEGNKHLISWTSINQFDDHGELVQIVGAGTNLTKERQRAKIDLERNKLESLGTMAGGIAHEINNALLPIILLVEDLQDRLKDADPQLVLNMKTIVEYALHAREIVQDILFYSRQSSREVEAFDVIELKEYAARFTRDVISSTVEIETYVDPKLESKKIKVDRTGFVQVLTNLMNNGAYAMEGKGQLKLSYNLEHMDGRKLALSNGDYVAISVQDTGSGIPEDKIVSIFDPFFTTKPEGEGSGLGLSVVYGLIKEWGGNIAVDSVLNEGTTITFYIPVCRS